MHRFFTSVTFKIGLIVILVKIVTMAIVGLYYNHFNSQLDQLNSLKGAMNSLFWAESMASIILIPLVILLLFRQMILTRLSESLSVLRRVEAGDLSARVSGPISQDEIGQLQQGINSMTKELHETISALKKEILVGKQAEDALSKEHKLLRTLINNVPDLVYVKDRESRFLIANDETARVMGVTTSDELIGKTDFDFYPPELAKQYYTDEQAVIESGKLLINKDEPILERETGRTRWFLTTKVPFRDSQDNILGLVGINRDISERKRAEGALHRSKNLFHSLIEALPQNVFSKDLEGRFTFANQRCCTTQGKPLADIIGKTDFDLHPYELAEKYRADDRWVIETGQILETVEEHHPLGKERFYVQVVKAPMYDFNGQITGILGIFWDITEHKRVERIQMSLYRISEAAHTARKLEELFHSIHEIVGELIPAKNFYIALYDSTAEVLSFPYFMDEYDETPAPRRLGKGVTEYVLRTEAPLLVSPELFEKLEKQGDVEQLGSLSVNWLGVPLKVHEKVIGVLAVQHYTEGIQFGEEEKNILMFVSTQIAMAIERVRAEEALRKNEERYRILVENAPLGIISVDSQGQIMDVNSMLIAMFGSPSVEAAREINIFTSPSLVNAGIADDFRRCLNSGYPDISERRYTTEWGKQVYLRYHLSPIRDSDESIIGIQAIVEDNTERILVEEALKESEAEYRSLFRNMHSGLAYHKLIVDTQNRPVDYIFLDVNEAFETLTGLQDVVGKRATEVFPELDRMEPDLIRVYGQVALTGEEATFDIYFERFGLWFSISAYSPEQGYFVTVLHDITERKWAEEALRKLNEDLEQRVTARTRELQRTNKFLQESLETLERTQRQLVESEKMAALGGLVAGVAHEINTPLGIGVTAASHLDQQSRELEQLYRNDRMTRSDLERYVKTACDSTAMILENLRRAAANIKSFKQVAVDQTSDTRREFKLKQCVENVLLSLYPKLKRTQHTVTVVCPEDLELDSYPGAFSQIVTNFVMNSLMHGFEFGDEAGQIVLEIRAEEGVLWLRYSDNGRGMNEEERSRIFEPFYTTKRGQGGSGLGLHIVYNLVTQALGGRIKCESIPGSGTTFTIVIPIK